MAALKEVPHELSEARKKAGLCIKCGVAEYEPGGSGHNSRTCKAPAEQDDQRSGGREEDKSLEGPAAMNRQSTRTTDAIHYSCCTPTGALLTLLRHSRTSSASRAAAHAQGTIRAVKAPPPIPAPPPAAAPPPQPRAAPRSAATLMVQPTRRSCSTPPLVKSSVSTATRRASSFCAALQRPGPPATGPVGYGR